ncbi:MAG: hypothetical protein SGCHY_000901 [Lobulomycetales sp.]
MAEYNVAWHVASIFVLAVVSVAGCAAPLLFHLHNPVCEDDCRGDHEVPLLQEEAESPGADTPAPGRQECHPFIKLGMLFGAGTLLSTGFIHMLAPSIPPLEEADDCRSPVTDSVISPEVADPNQGIHVKILLLEVAISVHSVFVGVALGVADSTRFTQMLGAISFHQFFEGVALSTTIMNANLPLNKILVLSGVFSATTPFGIMIGIFLRAGLAAESPASLITQGVIDAVSGGILIYSSLEIFFAEVSASKCFSALKYQSQAQQLFAMWLGAAIMAVLGIYA